MNNYFDPFQKRTFPERISCVFAFAKQNFKQVLRLNLFPLIVMASLYSCLEASPFKYFSGIWGFPFICYAYFSHYITNRGDMQKTTFKDMLNSVERAFEKVFMASVCCFVYIGLPFLVILAVYMLVLPLTFGDFSNNMITATITIIPIVLFCLYTMPILTVFYTHYYFSSKFKDGIDILKESFRLVKGHWWDTFGIMLIFGLLKGIITVPFLFIFSPESIFGIWIKNVVFAIICFFMTEVVNLYQYGHLKTLKEESGEKASLTSHD